MRESSHFSTLRSGSHHIKAMQSDFNEKTFIFEIIESGLRERVALKKEKQLIANNQLSYNRLHNPKSVFKGSHMGRKPIPEGQKKVRVTIYIEQERIDSVGGMEAAQNKLLSLADQLFK